MHIVWYLNVNENAPVKACIPIQQPFKKGQIKATLLLLLGWRQSTLIGDCDLSPFWKYPGHQIMH